MRNKILILVAVMAFGLVGCSKEDANTDTQNNGTDALPVVNADANAQAAPAPAPAIPDSGNQGLENQNAGQVQAAPGAAPVENQAPITPEVQGAPVPNAANPDVPAAPVPPIDNTAQAPSPGADGQQPTLAAVPQNAASVANTNVPVNAGNNAPGGNMPVVVNNTANQVGNNPNVQAQQVPSNVQNMPPQVNTQQATNVGNTANAVPHADANPANVVKTQVSYKKVVADPKKEKASVAATNDDASETNVTQNNETSDTVTAPVDED